MLEFNSISLFIFLSKHKAFCKQNFLEHFSNKDLKNLHRQLNPLSANFTKGSNAIKKFVGKCV